MNLDTVAETPALEETFFERTLQPIEAEDGWIEGKLGRAYVVRKAELIDPQLWKGSFEHACLDARFYHIAEKTVPQDFEHRYLILQDLDGRVRAVQPMFFVNQDITAGLSGALKSVMKAVRRFFPNFLKLRTLMVGATVGESHLGAPCNQSRDWLGEALHELVGLYARRSKASLVVLKDFPSCYRKNLAPFSNNGYARIPSFPAVQLDLTFKSFEEYMGTHLSKVTRKGLRRKFRRATQHAPIEMSVQTNVSDIIQEIYPLYEAVWNRSEYHFEKLTPEYFIELGLKMPDRARFFVWRQNGKIIAFDLCLAHEGVLYDVCMGLDYSVALDLHLYFLTWRDIVEWAVRNEMKTYHSAALNYDSKLHFRCDLAPLDLYVCHTSGWINPLFRRVVRFLEPTRHDPIIHRFPNAHEL